MSVLAFGLGGLGGFWLATRYGARFSPELGGTGDGAVVDEAGGDSMWETTADAVASFGTAAAGRLEDLAARPWGETLLRPFGGGGGGDGGCADGCA